MLLQDMGSWITEYATSTRKGVNPLYDGGPDVRNGEALHRLLPTVI